jgi:hypothetical protein
MRFDLICLVLKKMVFCFVLVDLEDISLTTLQRTNSYKRTHNENGVVFSQKLSFFTCPRLQATGSGNGIGRVKKGEVIN